MRRNSRIGLIAGAIALSVMGAPAATAQARDIGTYLLDEEQQERCLVQHITDEIFDEYTYRWMGEDVWVQLECGTDAWGYRHILLRHQADWQAQLDAGRAAGWKPETQGIHTWDDLMNFAVREAVERPGLRNIYTNGPKGCGIVELGFPGDDPDSTARFSFTATAVWNTDSGSIISAYPSTKTTC